MGLPKNPHKACGEYGNAKAAEQNIGGVEMSKKPTKLCGSVVNAKEANKVV